MHINTAELLGIIRGTKNDAEKVEEIVDNLLPKNIFGKTISETIEDFVEGDIKRTLQIMSISLTLLFESQHPVQNWQEVVLQVAMSVLGNEPLSMWMFGCLVTSSKGDTSSNWPSVKIVDAKTRSNRIEQTKKRTKELHSILTELGCNLQWYVPIVDTDIDLLYNRILVDRENGFEQSLLTAQSYISRLQDFARNIGNNVFVSSWSIYRDGFISQYNEARQNALSLISNKIPEQALEESLERRYQYFRSLGLEIDDKIKSLAEDQMISQISGYAAEGELLLRHIRPFSILVIADNDALRFAQYHSILTGEQLPIWMPYEDDK